jgi:hypothetical protein
MRRAKYCSGAAFDLALRRKLEGDGRECGE